MQTGSMNSLGANYSNYSAQKKPEPGLEKVVAGEVETMDEPPMLKSNPETLQSLDHQLVMNIGLNNEIASIVKKEEDKVDDAEEIAQEEIIEQGPEQNEETTGASEQTEAAGDAQAPAGAEAEMIADMKKTIKQTSNKVAFKVNKQAFKYMERNNWLSENSRNEAQEFFTIKVPKVMAKELSKILNEALGLEPSDKSADADSQGVA